LGAVFAGGLDEFFGGDVDAEVDDFESTAFEHSGDEVFADIVEVAFDGTDDDAADGFGAAGGEDGANEFEGGLHGARGEEEFGHEIIATFEATADFGHGRGHVLVDEDDGVDVFFEGLFGDGAGGGGIAVDHGVVELGEVQHDACEISGEFGPFARRGSRLTQVNSEEWGGLVDFVEREGGVGEVELTLRGGAFSEEIIDVEAFDDAELGDSFGEDFAAGMFLENGGLQDDVGVAGEWCAGKIGNEKDRGAGLAGAFDGVEERAGCAGVGDDDEEITGSQVGGDDEDLDIGIGGFEAGEADSEELEAGIASDDGGVADADEGEAFGGEESFEGFFVGGSFEDLEGVAQALSGGFEDFGGDAVRIIVAGESDAFVEWARVLAEEIVAQIRESLVAEAFGESNGGGLAAAGFASEAGDRFLSDDFGMVNEEIGGGAFGGFEAGVDALEHDAAAVGDFGRPIEGWGIGGGTLRGLAGRVMFHNELYRNGISVVRYHV
jgi:hypothetical protein